MPRRKSNKSPNPANRGNKNNGTKQRQTSGNSRGGSTIVTDATIEPIPSSVIVDQITPDTTITSHAPDVRANILDRALNPGMETSNLNEPEHGMENNPTNDPDNVKTTNDSGPAHDTCTISVLESISQSVTTPIGPQIQSTSNDNLQLESTIRETNVIDTDQQPTSLPSYSQIASTSPPPDTPVSVPQTAPNDNSDIDPIITNVERILLPPNGSANDPEKGLSESPRRLSESNMSARQSLDRLNSMIPDVGFFRPILFAAEILMVLIIVLTAVWVSTDAVGGLDLGDANLMFNYHPLFMVIGMICLHGNGKPLTISFYLIFLCLLLKNSI